MPRKTAAPVDHGERTAEPGGYGATEVGVDDPPLKLASNGIDEFAPETTSNPSPAAARRQRANRETFVETELTKDYQPDPGVVAHETLRQDTSDHALDARPNADAEFGSLDDDRDFLSVLYFGTEGTGKTTASCQITRLDQPGRVLVVNAEAGLKRTALQQMGVDTSRIVTWPRQGQRPTFDGLEKLFFRLQADLDKDPDSWLAVIWDSVTDIHQELLDQVVEAQMAQQQEIVDKAAARGQRAGNIKLRDRFDNDRDDYRRMSNQMRTLLRKYRYLPCHFIATALLRTDEVEGTKRVMYGPAVTPAIQSDLLGYVDIVLYCKAVVMKSGRVLYGQTGPTATERGKDRYNVLPFELVNPGADRVHAYVSGKLTDSTDLDQRALNPDTPASAEQANKAAREEVEGDLAKTPRKRPARKTAAKQEPPVESPVEEECPF